MDVCQIHLEDVCKVLVGIFRHILNANVTFLSGPMFRVVVLLRTFLLGIHWESYDASYTPIKQMITLVILC